MIEKNEYEQGRVTSDSQFSLKILQKELEKALQLIDRHHLASNNTVVNSQENFSDSISLLERCRAVTEQDKHQKKPILRVIHHFACSGGTLISKCIAAQPNVFLLSELHPTTRLGIDYSNAQYTPRDVVTQAIYGRIPDVDSLAEKIFVQNIIETEKHVRSLGGYLVIRAHSHSDYCTNQALPEVDTVTRLLGPYFEIKQLVTTRNPIDSFLSLQQNNWVHFAPDGFDEYCRRLISFISFFSENEIIKYEDFVADPNEISFKITKILNIPKKDTDLDFIDIFKVSGDSGRKGIEITKRSSREISEEYREAIRSSENFRLIKSSLGYSL